MLAAAPDDKQSVDLVRTLLELIQQHNQSIPQPLQKHLIAVIEQARLLSDNPESVRGDIFPEAIRLALTMRVRADLASDLNKISSFDSIEPNLAARILSEINHGSSARSAA